MPALLILSGVVSAAVVWSAVCEVVALRVLRSPHVVYFLVDAKGAVLYVGSTNDWRRRYREHVDPAEPGEWRRQVANMAVVKHCWSMRQARRVERRMIRAVWDGCRWRMCPPIWNVALARSGAVLSLPRFVWLLAYRAHGVIWPTARFHAPNPAAWSRTGKNTVHDDVNDVIVPGVGHRYDGPVDDWPASQRVRPQMAPLGALPPADMSAPLTGDADTPPDAPARTPLRVVSDGHDTGHVDETPAERRRRKNREHKQAQRARDAARKASSL